MSISDAYHTALNTLIITRNSSCSRSHQLDLAGVQDHKALLEMAPLHLFIDDRHIRVIHRHTGQLIREFILDPATTTKTPRPTTRATQGHSAPPAGRCPDPRPTAAPTAKVHAGRGPPARATALTAARTMPTSQQIGIHAPEMIFNKQPESATCPETPVNGVPRYHRELARVTGCTT
jgi:hypothetical protein